MTGLPTILVELDDGTGTFPYNITADVRLEGSGYSLNRGREDTQAAVTAGSLTMTLKNHDGKYSFNSTVLDSPSPIVVDQKIRIKETINATTFTRFTGYVKSWPTAWPGAVDTFSLVNLTATDAQARGERKPLRSIAEEAILGEFPGAYYMLDEPEGAITAVDSTGGTTPALTPAGSGAEVTFGASPLFTADGGKTCAQFQGAQYLSTSAPTFPASSAALNIAFSTTSGATSMALIGASDGLSWNLSMSAGALSLFGVAIGSGTYNDGEPHVITIDNAGSTTPDVYIDGVLTDTDVPVTAGINPGLRIGQSFIGFISHVAVWSATTGDFDAEVPGLALTTGFGGESGTDRITRLAGYAGIPVGTLDPSLTNVAAVDTSGVHAWPAIQDTVDAEGGLAYINGSGDLIFFNRHDAPGKTAPDITLSAAFVRPDAQPTGDDESLKNYFAATAQGTGVQQVVRDEDSENAHGQYPDSKTYLVQTDAEALDRANWIVGNYAEPTTRWPSMTLLLHKMTAAQAAAVLAIEPGTWLRVTDFPSQTPDDTTVDVMVEGISETCSADEWTLTLNVVARELFQAWILGDSTYGVLGSTTRLGV